jgi:hypothetical protein
MLGDLCINKEFIRVKVSLMLPPVAGVEKTEFDLNLEREEILSSSIKYMISIPGSILNPRRLI